MIFLDLFRNNESKEKGIRFTDNLSYPLMKIVSKFKDFFALACIVSFAMSLVSFICGRGFFCGLQIGFFCSATIFSSIVSLLFSLYGAAFFVNRWELVAHKDETVWSALKKKCFTKDLKAVGVILLYFVLWGGVGICSYALKLRQPMNNWVLELGVFVLFSAIIIFCLLLLLNFAGFYHYLQGGKFFTLHKTIGKIIDSIYAVASVFFIYMLIFVFFIFRGEAFLIKFLQQGLIVEYLGEFYLYFVFCTIFAVFVCSFNYQEQKLFGDE